MVGIGIIIVRERGCGWDGIGIGIVKVGSAWELVEIGIMKEILDLREE